MKKSTLMIIFVIYIASIVTINFFGMAVKVYDKIINVESIECINKSDEEKGIIVDFSDTNNKNIFVEFREAVELDENEKVLNPNTATGLLLDVHVYPNNASNRDVKFIYDKTKTSFMFIKDGNGFETRQIYFFRPTQLEVKIISTDGTKITEKITITAM